MYEQLCELHKLSFPNKPWGAADFQSMQQNGAEIICSDNGFIVWRVTMDEAEIITIGVHPGHRGAGIGRALLTIAEIEIKKKPVVKIFLEVAEDNIPARILYEKSGYRVIGRRPKYYDGDIDAILMEKAL